MSSPNHQTSIHPLKNPCLGFQVRKLPHQKSGCQNLSDAPGIVGVATGGKARLYTSQRNVLYISKFLWIFYSFSQNYWAKGCASKRMTIIQDRRSTVCFFCFAKATISAVFAKLCSSNAMAVEGALVEEVVVSPLLFQVKLWCLYVFVVFNLPIDVATYHVNIG